MVVCFACGAELVPSLEEAGSLRCQDCRDAAAPLRAQLVRFERRERKDRPERPARPQRPERPGRPVLTLIRTLPVRPQSTYEPPPLAAA
jgi:hypothetical protein